MATKGNVTGKFAGYHEKIIRHYQRKCESDVRMSTVEKPELRTSSNLYPHRLHPLTWLSGPELRLSLGDL